MKIILLIIPSMIYGMHTTNYNVTENISHTLNNSIPLLRKISNVNKTLYLNMNYFKNIQNIVYLTGEISKNYLNINFSRIKDLTQLNNFNKEIAPLDNIRYTFVNIVISLINNVFKSIPEEDVEVSNKSNSLMSWFTKWFTKNKQNQITLSIKHEYRTTEIKFICNLSEDPKTTIIVPSFNPNEQEEENESEPLLEKK